MGSTRGREGRSRRPLYLLPALVVDFMAGMIPGLFQSVALCMLAAMLATATRFFSTLLIDTLAGMEPDILLQHALVKSVGNLLFGMAGGIAVPAVIRKLKAYGAISEHHEGRQKG